MKVILKMVKEMGDWFNDKELGKHVTLNKNGKVEEINY